jgi:Zn-dependent protease
VESSFRLGRIAGVDVGVNWNWLVVFALITWSLAVGMFPRQEPGRSQGTYVAMAVVAAVLFFASLLAHELGHALTARREGMQLDGITLWLFGDVARFKGQFPCAGAELRIALAGRAVSLATGVACSLLAWGIPLPGGVDGVLAWLGYVNLILLAFNMLPALPLDGGRVLRALLWRAKNDFAWATKRGRLDRARLRLSVHRRRHRPDHLPGRLRRRLACVRRLVSARRRHRRAALPGRPPGPRRVGCGRPDDGRPRYGPRRPHAGRIH